MSLESVVPDLACVQCGATFLLQDRTLRCASGHAFDLARQGYVNFLTAPPGAAADDAAMVAARQEVLDSGLYAPFAQALAAAAASIDLPDGIVLDVGAGTGYYTAAVLDALPGRVGVALDLSAHAARRAARAHPRLGAVVGDVRRRLPVRDGGAAVILDVFAPRNPPEFTRALAPGGAVLVVTPAADHLTELVTLLGMPHVDPLKAERLAEAFGDFTPGPVTRVRDLVDLMGGRAAELVTMGPGAHHVTTADLAELSAEAQVQVTLAVDVSTFLRPS